MKNPINYSFKTEIFPYLILLLSVVVSFWAYPLLPDVVVSHWNFNGQADGWSSRVFHCLFFPLLLFGVYFLFSVMPKFDPQRIRYEEFSKVYLMMRNAILFFLFIIFCSATLFNIGYQINIGAIVSGSVGLLMIILGNYFGKLKKNYFVGIKTPWTLSSENVWNKTHRLSSYLFIVWGFLLALTPWLLPKLALIITFGGVLVLVFGVTLYSYYLYRKEQK